MNRSEAGRLGYLAGKGKHDARRLQTHKDAVARHAGKKCQNCKTPIPYEKRRNTFCSRSCAAKLNGKLYPKRKPEGRPGSPKIDKLCAQCKAVAVKALHNTYCSRKCMGQAHHEKRMATGEASSQTQRKHLIKTYGRTCSICGLSEWQGESIPIELDHIDGNSENNSRENLRLVCPNCHALTPTYGIKNLGNGRHKRRERYRQGKSY